MSVKPIKLTLIVCLLSSVLLFILGCMLGPNPNSSPIRSLKINIDPGQREEFFTQMRKFADKHSLEFTLSLYGSDGEIFLVAMYGNGYKISASDIPETAREIEIGFYNETSSTTPIPQDTVDELFNDLKIFISEIPNVTIVDPSVIP
jgi:hypothetical protein